MCLCASEAVVWFPIFYPLQCPEDCLWKLFLLSHNPNHNGETWCFLVCTLHFLNSRLLLNFPPILLPAELPLCCFKKSEQLGTLLVSSQNRLMEVEDRIRPESVTSTLRTLDIISQCWIFSNKLAS